MGIHARPSIPWCPTQTHNSVTRPCNPVNWIKCVKVSKFFPFALPRLFHWSFRGSSITGCFCDAVFPPFEPFLGEVGCCGWFLPFALWLLCAPLFLSEMMVLRFLLWSVICKALMRAEAYLLSRTVAACSYETFIKELKGHLTILLVMSWCLCI